MMMRTPAAMATMESTSPVTMARTSPIGTGSSDCTVAPAERPCTDSPQVFLAEPPMQEHVAKDCSVKDDTKAPLDTRVLEADELLDSSTTSYLWRAEHKLRANQWISETVPKEVKALDETHPLRLHQTMKKEERRVRETVLRKREGQSFQDFVKQRHGVCAYDITTCLPIKDARQGPLIEEVDDASSSASGMSELMMAFKKSFKTIGAAMHSMQSGPDMFAKAGAEKFASADSVCCDSRSHGSRKEGSQSHGSRRHGSCKEDLLSRGSHKHGSYKHGVPAPSVRRAGGSHKGRCSLTMHRETLRRKSAGEELRWTHGTGEVRFSLTHTQRQKRVTEHVRQQAASGLQSHVIGPSGSSDSSSSTSGSSSASEEAEEEEQEDLAAQRRKRATTM